MKRLVRKFNYIKYRNIRGMRDYFDIYTIDMVPYLIKYVIIFILIIFAMVFVYNQIIGFFGSGF